MSTFTVEMTLDKSTKNTNVYKATHPDTDRITTLYVAKDGKPAPAIIYVTVQEHD